MHHIEVRGTPEASHAGFFDMPFLVGDQLTLSKIYSNFFIAYSYPILPICFHFQIPKLPPSCPRTAIGHSNLFQFFCFQVKIRPQLQPKLKIEC